MDIPSISPVDAHFINLLCVLAEILDMTQNVAAAVLADEVAQVRPQTHVCNSTLVVAPFLDGKALEEDKALAVNQIFAQCLQERC